MEPIAASTKLQIRELAFCYQASSHWGQGSRGGMGFGAVQEKTGDKPRLVQQRSNCTSVSDLSLIDIQTENQTDRHTY